MPFWTFVTCGAATARSTTFRCPATRRTSRTCSPRSPFASWTRSSGTRRFAARQFALYDEAVADLEGITPLSRDERDVHALHLYVVRVDEDAAGASRDDYQRALLEENIQTSIHFLPVHELSFYRERFPDQPRLPVAERAGAEILSLPLSPAHSDSDIGDVIAALQRVHARFTE